MFRDVLVVVDATPDAREALSQGIDLARRERSRLTLITVERRLPACAYVGVAAALPLVIPAAEAEARELMCEALSHVPADVPATTVLATPPVRQALLTQIKRGGHDLVVMGARPHGRVRSAFGSLTNYLVRRSPAPVMVVQATSPRGPSSTRPEASRHRTRRWATRSRVA
ncbi:MAG TPA: universal stress protein [Solirubrobacteraceae bacterium]|jgi:nucleotide-binding universal stress UspA family protein|nr:universal stress protein [Solirubrobacteraceae bacterium]